MLPNINSEMRLRCERPDVIEVKQKNRNLMFDAHLSKNQLIDSLLTYFLDSEESFSPKFALMETGRLGRLDLNSTSIPSNREIVSV